MEDWKDYKKVPVLDEETGEMIAIPKENLEQALSLGKMRVLTSKEFDQQLFREEERESSGLGAFTRSAVAGATFDLSRSVEDKLNKELGIGLSSEEQKIQMEESPVASTVGEITGIGGSLLLPGAGPIGAISRVGRGATKATHKALTQLAKSEGGNAIAKRIVGSKLGRQTIASATGGVVEGGAVGLAQGVGSSLFEDGELSGERILANAGVGSLVGGIANPALRQVGKAFGPASKMARLSDDFFPTSEDLRLRSYSNSIGVPQKYKAQFQDMEQTGMRVLSQEMDSAGNFIKNGDTLQKRGVISQVGTLKNKERYGDLLNLRKNRVGEDLAGLYAQMDEMAENLVNPEEVRRGALKIIDERIKLHSQNQSKTSGLNTLKELKKNVENAPDEAFGSYSNLWKRKRQAGDEALWIETPENKASVMASDNILQKELYSYYGDVIENQAKNMGDDFYNAYKAGNKEYADLKKLTEIVEKKALKDAHKPVVGFIDMIGMASSILDPRLLVAMGLRKVGSEFFNETLAVALNRVGKDEIKGLGKVIQMEETTKKAIKKASEKMFSSKVGAKEALKQEAYKSISDFKYYDGEKSTDTQESFRKNIEAIKDLSQNPQRLIDNVSERTMGVSEINDSVGTAMIGGATRAVQFLNSKIPDNPFAGRILSKEYTYPSIEIAKFTRYLNAVENPMSVVDGVVAGRVSPEEIEALKVVYPKLYSDIQMSFMEYLADESKVKNLSYEDKLSLSNLLDIPVDGLTDGAFIARLQMNFAMPEQGTGQMGGGRPPRKADLTFNQMAQTNTDRVSSKG